MDLQLDIVDINRNPFDTSDTIVESGTILVDIGNTPDFLSSLTNLEAGNSYTIRFIDGGGSIITATSAIEITSPDDGSINIEADQNVQNGITDLIINPVNDITTLELTHNGGAADSFSGTIQILGENITITLDDGISPPFIFNGSNTIIQALANNSQVSVTVTSNGFYSYSNIINVYHKNEQINVLLSPIINDPNDPNYRKPYPNFFYILEPCSFNVYIYDGQAAPFGTICYEQNGIEFSIGQKNTIYNTCIPDIISITQRIKVREQFTCSSLPPIEWDEFYTINGIQTIEYRPSILLDTDFRCCIPKDEELIVLPSILNMNAGAPHDTCTIGTDPNVELIYTIITPSNQTIVLVTYTAAQIAAGPLANLGFTYTPAELGTYTLNVSLTNCCDTIITEYKINICESWEITNTDCNKLNIANLSDIYTLTYTLKKLNTLNQFEIVTIDNILQKDILIGGNGEVLLDVIDDNIYTLDLLTNTPSAIVQERIFLLDCNIKKCKKNFLIALNCPADDCSSKCARAQLIADYNYFKALEEIIYHRWDIWLRQQTIYPTFSINDIMESVLSIKELMIALADICDDCNTITKKDCGC